MSEIDDLGDDVKMFWGEHSLRRINPKTRKAFKAILKGSSSRNRSLSSRWKSSQRQRRAPITLAGPQK